MKFFEFKTSKSNKVYRIPNSWEALTPNQYRYLSTLIDRYASGKLSIAMARVYFVCYVMSWSVKRIKDEDALANVYYLSENITFLFKIKYDEGVFDGLSMAEKKLCRTTMPEKLPVHLKRFLSKYKYKFVLKDCFCAQLVPEIKVGETVLLGYRISCGFDELTCSLTALQYIEASRLIGSEGRENLLPLLAAILYFPEKEYDSEKAQELAFKLVDVPVQTLHAISFNFSSISNFIFLHTHFRLLTMSTLKNNSTIVNGPLESLYNLCEDGVGNYDKVENMNLITYLTLVRKKLISSIQSLSSAGMKLPEIEKESGLPIDVITEIIKS